MPDWIAPLLIALASGGLLTGLAALFNGRAAARKDELQSLRETIRTLQEENARLKVWWSEIAAENKYYRRWAERLSYQVISLGAVPCTPEEPAPLPIAVRSTRRKKEPQEKGCAQ